MPLGITNRRTKESFQTNPEIQLTPASGFSPNLVPFSIYIIQPTFSPSSSSQHKRFDLLRDLPYQFTTEIVVWALSSWERKLRRWVIWGKLGWWQQAWEQWRHSRIRASADGTTLWGLFTSMPRPTSGPLLRPRSSLLPLLPWFPAEWETRRPSSQRSLWGLSCTWAAGDPTEEEDMKMDDHQPALEASREGIFQETYGKLRWRNCSEAISWNFCLETHELQPIAQGWENWNWCKLWLGLCKTHII